MQSDIKMVRTACEDYAVVLLGLADYWLIQEQEYAQQVQPKGAQIAYNNVINTARRLMPLIPEKYFLSGAVMRAVEYVRDNKFKD